MVVVICIWSALYISFRWEVGMDEATAEPLALFQAEVNGAPDPEYSKILPLCCVRLVLTAALRERNNTGMLCIHAQITPRSISTRQYFATVTRSSRLCQTFIANTGGAHASGESAQGGAVRVNVMGLTCGVRRMSKTIHLGQPSNADCGCTEFQ